MAKIYVFAGRVHHVERLSSVVNLLIQKKHDVHFVTSDNYVNIDPNTSHLIQAGIPFIHILDYLPTGNGAQSMTADALRRIDHIADFVDPFYLAGSVREASESLLAFASLLTKESPDLVLGLHENNFWYRMLAYLCSRCNIPSVSFQEGTLRLRDEKTQGKQSIAADYSTKLMCWSDMSRMTYINAGVNPDKLVVTGISHLDPYMQPYNKQQLVYNLGFDPNKSLSSFLLPQTHRYDGNWKSAISEMVGWANNSGNQLALRFHPFEDESVSENIRPVGKNVRIVSVNTLDLIRASSMVISQHSTVAAETIALGVPLVELDLDNFGVLESLAEQGVATLIRAGEISKLTDVLTGKIVVDADKLKAWSQNNLGPLDGHSTERVVEQLEVLL